MGQDGNIASRLTVNDLQEAMDLAARNSLEEIRAKRDSGARILAVLGKRLSDLRADESRLLNKMYPMLSVDQLASKKAGYQNTLDPINVYDIADTDIGIPTERVTTYYQRLKDSIKELNRQLVAKQNEIHDVLSQIKEQQYILDNLNKSLEAKNAPKDTELEEDRFLRRQASEVMMLWEIQQQYKMYSSNVDGGVGFSQNPQIVAMLDNLKNRFVTLCQYHPEIKLDVNNPGSIANEKAIRDRMSILKATVAQSKVPDNITALSNNLSRHMNDNLVQTGVSRRKSLDPLPEENSMNDNTKTTSRFIKLTQKVANWTTSFDLTSMIEAKQRAFLSETSSLNRGCPLCEDLPVTQEDKNKTEQKVKNDALELKASENAKDKISKQAVAEVPGPAEGIDSLLKTIFENATSQSTFQGINKVTDIYPKSPYYTTFLSSIGVPINQAGNNDIYLAQGFGATQDEAENAALTTVIKSFKFSMDVKKVKSYEESMVELDLMLEGKEKVYEEPDVKGIISTRPFGNGFTSYAYAMKINSLPTTENKETSKQSVAKDTKRTKSTPQKSSPITEKTLQQAFGGQNEIADAFLRQNPGKLSGTVEVGGKTYGIGIMMADDINFCKIFADKRAMEALNGGSIIKRVFSKKEMGFLSIAG